MLEHGLAKTAGLKVFGSQLLGFSLIVFGGVFIWKLWKDKRIAQNTIHKYDETLHNIKVELSTLKAEQVDFSIQMSQLQNQLSERSIMTRESTIKSAPAHPFQESPNSNKFMMLKQIIEDNIQLRQAN